MKGGDGRLMTDKSFIPAPAELLRRHFVAGPKKRIALAPTAVKTMISGDNTV